MPLRWAFSLLAWRISQSVQPCRWASSSSTSIMSPQLVQGALLQELPHLFPELVLQALDVLLVPQGADNRCASLLADDVGHIVPHQLVVDMLFHTVRHVSFLKYFENPSPRRGRALAARWARAAASCHKRDVTAEALRLHAPLLGMRWVFIPPGKYRISNNPFPAHSTPAAVPQKLALPVSAFLPRHRPVWDTFIPLGRCRTSNNPFQAHSIRWDGPGPGRGPPPGAAPPGRRWRRFGASSGTGRPS